MEAVLLLRELLGTATVHHSTRSDLPPRWGRNNRMPGYASRLEVQQPLVGRSLPSIRGLSAKSSTNRGTSLGVSTFSAEIFEISPRNLPFGLPLTNEHESEPALLREPS